MNLIFESDSEPVRRDRRLKRTVLSALGVYNFITRVDGIRIRGENTPDGPKLGSHHPPAATMPCRDRVPYTRTCVDKIDVGDDTIPEPPRFLSLDTRCIIIIHTLR